MDVADLDALEEARKRKNREAMAQSREKRRLENARRLALGLPAVEVKRRKRKPSHKPPSKPSHKQAKRTKRATPHNKPSSEPSPSHKLSSAPSPSPSPRKQASPHNKPSSSEPEPDPEVGFRHVHLAGPISRGRSAGADRRHCGGRSAPRRAARNRCGDAQAA